MDAAKRIMIWRVSQARIEQVVSAHLGPGRVRDNAPGPCFSRRISMYLARHVGHWSLAQVGRFYNGRHHTMVLHAIAKIERFRRSDESVDALIEALTANRRLDRMNRLPGCHRPRARRWSNPLSPG